MGWIYKITNQVNGKVYIGKTECADPLDRWIDHKYDYKKPRNEKRPLYSAMNKYGVENFTFEPICCVNDSDELCEQEKYYIDKYRSYVGFDDCNGYNATLGGDGKPYLNLDENEVVMTHINNQYIIKKTAMFYGCDPNTIKNILKKHGVKWLSGDETRKLLYLQKYGGVVQLDESCDQVVGIYDTPHDVCEAYHGYKYNTLRYALRPLDPAHRAYGYVWYRLKELPDKYKPLLDDYYSKHK